MLSKKVFFVTLFIKVIFLGNYIYPQTGNQTSMVPAVLPLSVWQNNPSLLQVNEENHRDIKTLQKGKISVGVQIGSLILSVFPGLGAGQVAQGRPSFLITMGEAIGVNVGLVGAMGVFLGIFYDDIDSSYYYSMSITGAIIMWAFKIWEITDAIVYPIVQNKRYDQLILAAE